MSAELELVVDGLAVHRLTRLVVADRILEGPRFALVSALIELSEERLLDDDRASAADAGELVAMTEDPPLLAVLLTCRWCTGVWIAGGAAVARVLAPRWWRRVARVLALADLAGLLSELEG